MTDLRAGIFAEGPTDQRFLGRLVERLIEEIGNELLPAGVDVGGSYPIGSPSHTRSGQGHTIPEAIDMWQYGGALFILHADGEGDPAASRKRYIEPGLQEALAKHPDLVAVACIPNREIEAWMLADSGVFSRLIKGWTPDLPQNPEKVQDPKRELKQILATKKQRLDKAYELFGEQVSFASLRRLPSFRAFEAELRQALRKLLPYVSSP